MMGALKLQEKQTIGSHSDLSRTYKEVFNVFGRRLMF